MNITKIRVLRRPANVKIPAATHRPHLMEVLAEAEVVDGDLEAAIRELYFVANPKHAVLNEDYVFNFADELRKTYVKDPCFYYKYAWCNDACTLRWEVA